MTIQVVGALVHPMDGAVVDAIIRVTAMDTEESVLSLTASISTDATGDYNFNLVDGTHKIEVNFSDVYNMVGTVVIDGATPSPITLPALLVR